MTKREKVSVRITPNQELVLKELCDVTNVSFSMLIRTIIGSWLSEHEDDIYRLIDKRKLEEDPNYRVPNENNFDNF